MTNSKEMRNTTAMVLSLVSAITVALVLTLIDVSHTSTGMANVIEEVIAFKPL